MKAIENRFDPATLTAPQVRQLERIGEIVLAGERPVLGIYEKGAYGGGEC